MFLRRFAPILSLCCLAWIGPSFILAADEASDAETKDAPQAESAQPATTGKTAKLPDKAWRNAQRLALQKMKSKKEEHRAEAFAELKDFPTLECAKLLVQQGLASKFEDVRKEAYATLATFRDSPEVCNYLLTSVEKDSSKGMPSEMTCALFAVPLSSHEPEIEKKAFSVFDKAATQKKGGLLLLVSLADQLGAAGDDDSLATLVKISQRPIFDQQFGVRRSVVQAMTKIEEKEAVDALLQILSKAEGEIRGDIVQHLTAVSGEKFGLDPPAWEKWWKANREKFQFAAIGARAVNRAEAVRSRSMYHGLPIYASRLVFVIDTSGSMRGPPILAAVKELIDAVNGLPEGVYFNVLAFDRDVKPWQRKLAIASNENKKQLAHWIESQGLGGATASYDALEAALNLDTEAIYFLTDGAPHGGKVVIPAEIVEIISRLNFTRRITINCIGFGAMRLVPTDFLETLAARNYGEYRPVAFGE
ncbi:MAG TPA: VWA domain-containing protein [Pirellulales bacterium]|nr:VWA domain-containing protein [Pirellulales bacterium]